jgi:hypothetical protein
VSTWVVAGCVEVTVCCPLRWQRFFKENWPSVRCADCSMHLNRWGALLATLMVARFHLPPNVYSRVELYAGAQRIVSMATRRLRICSGETCLTFHHAPAPATDFVLCGLLQETQPSRGVRSCSNILVRDVP